MIRYGLGVDPGIANTGFGIVREVDGVCSYVAAGTVRTPPTLPLEARLERITRVLSGAWATVPNDGPMRVGIEMFTVTPARPSSTITVEGTLLVIGEARHLFRERARLYRVPAWHAALGIKVARGEDHEAINHAAVRAAVEARIGAHVKKSHYHAIDALALALAALADDSPFAW